MMLELMQTNNSPLWVNTANIMMMFQGHHGKGAQIYIGGGTQVEVFHVKETPEEIMVELT